MSNVTRLEAWPSSSCVTLIPVLFAAYAQAVVGTFLFHPHIGKANLVVDDGQVVSMGDFFTNSDQISLYSFLARARSLHMAPQKAAFQVRSE